MFTVANISYFLSLLQTPNTPYMLPDKVQANQQTIDLEKYNIP